MPVTVTKAAIRKGVRPGVATTIALAIATTATNTCQFIAPEGFVRSRETGYPPGA